MPRSMRVKSENGFYHVMVRGINKQKIFQEENDYKKFCFILKDNKMISDCKIFAFCLMPNHVHILIKIENDPLDVIMKRVVGRYACWYNKKYERVGHLFQDRFKSEIVDSEKYFVTVLRYIIQNPMKANLELEPGTYKWSSFGAYCGMEDHITDVDLAEKMFGSLERVINYFKQANCDEVMDTDDESRLSSEQAKMIFFKVSGGDTIEHFNSFSTRKQKQIILELNARGLTLPQIRMFTGKSKSTICRIKRSKGTVPECQG